MKRYFLIIISACLSISVAQAQQNYDAIVDESSTNVVCKDLKNATISEKRVVTILNENGKNNASIDIICDKWNKVVSFAGTITDKDGNVIRKVGKSELVRNDYSTELASDYYHQFFDYTPPRYPITITYEWKMSVSNGFISFPTFSPITEYRTKVTHATYSLTLSSGMTCRYKAVNTQPQVTERKTEKNGTEIRVVMNDLAPIEREDYSLPLVERLPLVFFSPDQFDYMGSQGGFSNWQDLGLWLYALNANRDELSNEFKNKLHALTDTCATDKSKITVLYQLLKETTRYVSIQLGIGGFQAATAQEVLRSGFGDCKGLTNFMHAMLKEVGINSNYTIISTENRYLYSDYASINQCNHAILQVPLSNDTLWIECTNPSLPLGYVHDHIAGHNAIVITSEGGRLVTLPQYPDSANLQLSIVDITVDIDGNANLRIKQKSTNHQYRVKSQLVDATERQKRDYLLESLSIPQATVESLEISDSNSPFTTPCLDVDAQLSIARYANSSGERLIIPVNPIHRRYYAVLSRPQRDGVVNIRQGYLDEEIINISIPEGYSIEGVQQDLVLEKPFGSVCVKVTVNDRQVSIHTALLMRSGSYSPEEFQQLCDFEKNVKSIYNQKLIIKK